MGLVWRAFRADGTGEGPGKRWSFAGFWATGRQWRGPAFLTLVRRCKVYRGWGDCYGDLMVATGRADLMLDPIMKEWDVAALIPVIRGAGGVISDWQGRDPVSAHSIVAAATPELHAETIAALNTL